LPLARRFIFPGFTERTGGLLREHGLLAARDTFRAEDASQAQFWSALGVPPPARSEIRISLFCYPNDRLLALLDAWADGDAPVTCLVPEGVATGALDAWTRGSVPQPGHPFASGRLTLHGMPFLSQDDYDRLLWASDVNFVRGEDSFVRAQWAERPFAWHIYPQQQDAHWRKLDTFLDRYTTGLDPAAVAAVRRFWEAWNGRENSPPMADAWLEFAAACPHLLRHGAVWTDRLARLPDLARALVMAARVGL
jgi:uncharacterized repeat protein (TIGR03837 family)